MSWCLGGKSKFLLPVSCLLILFALILPWNLLFANPVRSRPPKATAPDPYGRGTSNGANPDEKSVIWTDQNDFEGEAPPPDNANYVTPTIRTEVDTWTTSGEASLINQAEWLQKFTATTPTARQQHALAYDATGASYTHTEKEWNIPLEEKK